MSQSVTIPRKRRVPPSLALAVLSVVIAELLSGSTHLSTLFAIVPEILVWGLGALLFREIARRRNLSGSALLLMGLALSLAEEILIQQTSLTPLPWLGSAHIYGRAFGVNWIYLLFQLGYESVWVVVVPIALVELIYPEQRRQPWLRTRGLIVISVLFLLGARVAWYAWIKRVLPKIFHLPPYHPSPYAFLAGALAMLGLLAVALVLRSPQPAPYRAVPGPVTMFLIVLLLGLPWYVLLVFQFSHLPALTALPAAVPMAAGVIWGALAVMLLGYWSRAAAWTDMHRYACVFAAMLVCMCGGWLGAGAWLRIDKIAQLVFDLAAIALMVAFGRALKKRQPATMPA